MKSSALLEPGQRWEHHDGGTLYVLRVVPGFVTYQRRPPGDSEALMITVSIRKFSRMAKGLLN